jgi:hypothetical protein
MTSQGSAYARFNRAILTGNLTIVEAAARELPQVSLADALRILTIMAARRDERFGRAAARWAARVTAERHLGLDESRRVLALVDVLPDAPEAVAIRLRAYCG